MGLPIEFSDFLKLPVFLISVDQTLQRFHNSIQRIQEAGFTNLQVCQAIRGDLPEDTIRDIWNSHPPVQYDYKLLCPGPMGCLLSHLALLKHIIAENIPAAVVFEDDILFHSKWNLLAPKYYENTPKETDMIYMGHHCGNAIRELAIYRIPVFCTHAYVITQQGAQRLYDILIKYPFPDTHQIDMMLVKIQNLIMMEKSPFQLDWLVWNSDMFPDPETAPFIHPHVVHKDKGLVFQENYPKN